MNIFVGNLSYASGEDSIRSLFTVYGEVESVKVIVDRETGRSRGFGFVEMPNDDEARAAVEALDGKELDGRALRVNEARPRQDRRTGGAGGGGRSPRPSRW
jgi:RNA recognition motif-containing protein